METVLLTSQVGGHAGVRASADGSQILKPCLPTERAFYEKVITDDSVEGFRLLRKHVPAFYGVTPAEGQEGKDSIILENLSHRFTKPNILDIKLGTVLYDDAASPEKRERMIKSAKETTSLETGVRITGFQVYDTTTQKTINIPKDYGRALKVSQLPEAIARFFPIATPIVPLSTPTPTDEEGGHTEITPSPAGTPPNLLVPVLKGIVQSVRELRHALAKTEMRMVGGSILFIYEGDPEVLARALQSAGADAPANEDPFADGTLPIPIFSLKLIDFAHTILKEGLGPDEGVLLGVDTTIALLEARIKEVQEAAEA